MKTSPDSNLGKTVGSSGGKVPGANWEEKKPTVPKKQQSMLVKYTVKGRHGQSLKRGRKGVLFGKSDKNFKYAWSPKRGGFAARRPRFDTASRRHWKKERSGGGGGAFQEKRGKKEKREKKIRVGGKSIGKKTSRSPKSGGVTRPKVQPAPKGKSLVHESSPPPEGEKGPAINTDNALATRCRTRGPTGNHLQRNRDGGGRRCRREKALDEPHQNSGGTRGNPGTGRVFKKKQGVKKGGGGVAEDLRSGFQARESPIRQKAATP